MASPQTVVQAALAWPVTTQQRARRNALIASTALTQQRLERDEVERFLHAHARRWEQQRGTRAVRTGAAGVI